VALFRLPLQTLLIISSPFNAGSRKKNKPITLQSLVRPGPENQSSYNPFFCSTWPKGMALA
jgi:hypothetical protein